MLENGWELQKTHNLKFLYEEIEKIADLKLDKSIITKIYNGYSGTRYPDDYNPPSEEEVKEFYKFAQEVAEKIKQELT